MNKARRNARRKTRNRLRRPDECARLLGYGSWQAAYLAEGRQLSSTMAGTEICMHVALLALRHMSEETKRFMRSL